MILESIVTTRNASGVVNVAPMGPRVDEAFTTITLKPFRTSQTFANLRATSCAVIHVTDDVDLLAEAAIGRVEGERITEPLMQRWVKLVDCCRWFAVEVETWNDDPIEGEEPRPEAACRIVHRGEQRPMFGLSRAKHAVVEASIVATRVNMLGADEVRRQMQSLRVLIEKTGGASEHRAWQRLEAYVDGQN
jgi:uncharacterized protein